MPDKTPQSLAKKANASIRVIGLHDDDGTFDRDFWLTVPPEKRLEMVWDMVLEFQTWNKNNGDQPRLQRSVCNIERGRG